MHIGVRREGCKQGKDEPQGRKTTDYKDSHKARHLGMLSCVTASLTDPFNLSDQASLAKGEEDGDFPGRGVVRLSAALRFQGIDWWAKVAVMERAELPETRRSRNLHCKDLPVCSRADLSLGNSMSG